MKNLKKTLAVVLAFVMVLSMGAISTFAYSDVTAGTITDEAVSILSNLNILTGFEDGTFRPDETVTRAQMAAIICRTLGYESQAESSKGFTVFNDVAGDHWASGYVNVAQAQGIINGYGNGNFGPEDQVTYEQAVKMIVSALGYDLAAQSKGGYPTGYLAIASAEGITKNANGRVGDAAKRATIAVLVYNSLEVQLMDQTSWSTGTEGDKYTQTDKTVLSQYLDVIKVEGVVTAAPLVGITTYAADGPQNATVYGKEFYYSNGVYTNTADQNFPADCSLVDANALFGKKVVAYIGAHADKETGRKMIYAMSEKQGANEVTVINANQLTNATVDGEISYKKAGASRATDVKLATGAVAYKNFANQGITASSTGTDDIAGLVSAGVIELISNDNDSFIDYIMITAYDNEAVIETVENEDGIISFDLYKGSLDEVDTEEEDELVVVYKDGELTTVDALAANDTVSEVDTVGGLAQGVIRILYVSSKTVTGEVTKYDPSKDTVTIAGEVYELSANSNYANAAALAEKEGLFFLNVDGAIAHDEAEAAKGDYGLVLAVDTITGINSGYAVQIVTVDGTVATYDLASKVDYNGTKGDAAAAAAIQTIMGNVAGGTLSEGTITGAGTVSGTAYYATTATAKNLLYEVKIKNGKVTKLTSLTASAQKTGKEYDQENMSYSSLSFNDDTVVFALAPAYASANNNQTHHKIEAEDVKLGKVSDFLEDGEGLTYSLFGYDIDANSDISGAVVGYNLETAIPAEDAVVVITGVGVVKYDDDAAVEITGLQAGKEVSYIIYDEEASYKSKIAPEFLAAGDIIMVATPDANGVVNDFDTLYSDTAKDLDGGTSTAADAYEAAQTLIATNINADDIYYVIGAVDEDPGFEPTNGKFFFDSYSENLQGGINGHIQGDGVAMRDAANYVLVDYSNGSDAEISRKSKGKSIFGSLTKYNSFAFVRYYDDKLAEVVVYRY